MRRDAWVSACCMIFTSAGVSSRRRLERRSTGSIALPRRSARGPGRLLEQEQTCTPLGAAMDASRPQERVPQKNRNPRSEIRKEPRPEVFGFLFRISDLGFQFFPQGRVGRQVEYFLDPLLPIIGLSHQILGQDKIDPLVQPFGN